MNPKHQLSLLRRLQRPLAEGITSLRHIHGRIVVSIERELRRLFNDEGSLIPVPIPTAASRRRLDRRRSRD